MDLCVNSNPPNTTTNKRTTWIMRIVGLVIISNYFLFMIGSLQGDFDWVIRLTKEDGLFETIDAIGLFTTAIVFGLCLIYGRRQQLPLRRQLFLIGLICIFIFGAGEEISWGQRILGFSTPESVEAQNIQGEFNFHNLRVLGIDMTSLTRRAHTLFWMILMVGTPIFSKLFQSLGDRIRQFIIVYPIWMGILFAINYFLLRMIDFFSAATNPNFVLGQIEETNFAILFMMVAFFTLYMARNERLNQI